MKRLIVFVISLILLSASAYFYFHVVLRENVYNEWYERLCYTVCVIGSIMIAKEVNE